MRNSKIDISIFAPVYNEEGNLTSLFEDTRKVMQQLGRNWEFIFINDGSTDNSLGEILSIEDEKVRVISLRKNYGQSIAMNEGFRVSRGEIIISMDSDKQNDPADIPRLIEKLEKEDYDVVAGCRAKRKDPLWMLFVTKVARLLRSLFASDGVRDSGCTLRAYRKSVVEDLELWGEMHRYIMALLTGKGAKVTDIEVNHKPREKGISKYNFTKSIRGLVDLFYVWFWKKFASRPLHLFGSMGLLLIFLGILCGLWTTYLKVITGASLSDSVWVILTFFLALIGIQFFFSGIMMDIMIRNYYYDSLEKRYISKEIIKTIPDKK